mmetsp:Transcript_38034/g.88956  ORF Transcript_38034/g.88956 Transcript_38034/m.88956 type:complete len:243 (-) Transcript_38034:2942-3670(-)
MLHASHAAIAGPAHLVVVAHNVLVVWVWVLGQEPLDQVPRLLLCEAEHHDEVVQVTAIQPDGVAHFCLDIGECQELVWKLGWPGNFGCTRQTQQEQVQDQAVVLEHEGSKLQPLDQAVGVGVVHVLVVDGDVVLRSHVVRNVVVDDEPKQSVQQRQIHLLRHVLELGLQHHDALAIRCVPHVRQVIDALAPLVDKQWCWLSVGRLDPVGEEVAVISLIPQVLVQVGICDLLQRLDLVARHQM